LDDVLQEFIEAALAIGLFGLVVVVLGEPRRGPLPVALRAVALVGAVIVAAAFRAWMSREPSELRPPARNALTRSRRAY
jgi:hypothetical protein